MARVSGIRPARDFRNIPDAVREEIAKYGRSRAASGNQSRSRTMGKAKSVG